MNMFEARRRKKDGFWLAKEGVLTWLLGLCGHAGLVLAYHLRLRVRGEQGRGFGDSETLRGSPGDEEFVGSSEAVHSSNSTWKWRGARV